MAMPVKYSPFPPLSPPSNTTRILTPSLPSALDFTAQSLRRNTTNSSEELADSFRTAYTHTLKPHHSFIVKPIFSAAMSATPYRKDFYSKLGQDQAKVQEEMEKWLGALEERIKVLQGFLGRKESKW